MDKSRLMELAGVEKKPAKVQQLNESPSVVADIVHDAIWDVCHQLKVECPEHLINDAVSAASERYRNEVEAMEREKRDFASYAKY